MEPFWDAADPDGYYYAEPCDVCGEFIGGTTDNEFKRNMENHMIFNHPDLSAGDNPGFTWDTEPFYDYDWDKDENYLHVVSVSRVASVMKELLQITDCKWFEDEYYAYNKYGYIGKNKDVVTVSSMTNFIRLKFKTNGQLTLAEASKRNKKFMLFAKPSKDNSRVAYIGNRSCLYFNVLNYVSAGIIYFPQYLFIFD